MLYSLTYQETQVKPSFVVDISEFIIRKLEAIFTFHSQFAEKTSLGDVMPGGARPIREQLLAYSAYYGSLIRRPYGEPFWVKETMEVSDVVEMGVNSM